MKKSINILLFFAAVILVMVLARLPYITEEPDRLSELREKYTPKHIPGVDHSKLVQLQSEFTKAQDVTAACLSCHTERHTEIMSSSHWTWDREAFIPGRGVTYAGKKNLINNFCIGIAGSEQTCNKCHAGYGWGDKDFDFNNSHNIDCLVCHDNSGDYVKKKGGAGYPAESVNLNKVAQSVGKPQKTNCGSCHFYSGGGNNVKHGDLEDALLDASTDVDVHMGIDGMNMQCTVCHVTEHHEISGQLYSVSSMNRERVTCEQCHTETPHHESILNEHTIKVACQTCHIPEYAKVNSTKMTWDWSTAGKLKDGQPYHEEDERGNHNYLSIKGSFEWGNNLQPDYAWFNGTADHYFLGDKVESNEVVKMNTLFGSYDDANSKIIPVKIHRGKQIYDPVNKTLISPKLFDKEKGKGAFWKDFDWNTAAIAGMKEVGLPYSGEFSWVETEMYWPINHMVAKEDKSLDCIDCHQRDNGRLAGLNDFYMPGRDYNASLDRVGILMILLSLIGVSVHAVIRIIAARADKGGSKS